MALSEQELKGTVRKNLSGIAYGMEEEHFYRMYLKEDFRTRHHLAGNYKDEVMVRLYGIRSNVNAPVRIDEMALDRILNKYGDNGMVGISASRRGKDLAYNDKVTRNLINDLKNSGFPYLPVYGGSGGKNGVDADYDPSFMVFNHDTESNPTDFQSLCDFAVAMCGKYEQDSVLIKRPNEPTIIYVNCNGNEVNASGKVWKNYQKPACFTSLKSGRAVQVAIWRNVMEVFKTDCDKNLVPKTEANFQRFQSEHWNEIEKIGKRYAADSQFECYVNPMPLQIAERMRRRGEIMIWD